MSGYSILAFLIGGALGYLIFYFRYQHKDTVSQLRSNLKEANKELQLTQADLDEYSQQNIILKEEVTRLLEKNDDLTDVVTELSKYYVHMKKAAEKTSELTKFLHEPNSDVEDKIAHFNTKGKDDSFEKKFF